jgi:hypothetical protein
MPQSTIYVSLMLSEAAQEWDSPEGEQARKQGTDKTFEVGPFEFVQMTYSWFRIAPDGDHVGFVGEKDGLWYVRLTEGEDGKLTLQEGEPTHIFTDITLHSQPTEASQSTIRASEPTSPVFGDGPWTIEVTNLLGRSLTDELKDQPSIDGGIEPFDKPLGRLHRLPATTAEVALAQIMDQGREHGPTDDTADQLHKVIQGGIRSNGSFTFTTPDGWTVRANYEGPTT